jgi:hypothetical protein
MPAMQEWKFKLFLLIQRPMQTENRNIPNCSVSVKTSVSVVYCNATAQQYFPSGKGGFFYGHTR